MRDVMTRFWVRLAVRGEEGQGMMEYALVLVFVALIVITALTVFGTKISNIYNSVGNSLGT